MVNASSVYMMLRTQGSFNRQRGPCRYWCRLSFCHTGVDAGDFGGDRVGSSVGLSSQEKRM